MGCVARTLWLLTLPLLVAITIVHGTLEQTRDINIEHNLEVGERKGGDSSVSSAGTPQANQRDFESPVPIAAHDLTRPTPAASATFPSTPWDDCSASPLRIVQVTRLLC